MKNWTIPTILRELRRVYEEATGADIMHTETSGLTVEEMIEQLKDFHMEKEMEIPGQTAIPVEDEKGKKDS
jgi:methionine synthase I (cobalamin-dependent)